MRESTRLGSAIGSAASSAMMLCPDPSQRQTWWWHSAASVAPAEVVVVGDSRHDLAMARAAGTGAAVGVLSGTSGHDDLATLADAVIADISQLPNWLADQA